MTKAQLHTLRELVLLYPSRKALLLIHWPRRRSMSIRVVDLTRAMDSNTGAIGRTLQGDAYAFDLDLRQFILMGTLD